MSKQGIIFDLDGTLWDSCEAIMPSWQKVMKAHNVKRPPLSEEEMGSYMGKTVEQIAALMLPELPLDEAIAVMLEGCAEERVYLKEHGGKLYENILEVLHKLSESYELFIVSNSEDGYVQTFIEHYKLESIIKDFEMAGRTGKCKGENISLVMKRNGLDSAVYVGDTIMDKEAADMADIPFVYASYGFGNVESPEYIIQKPCDLLEVAKSYFI